MGVQSFGKGPSSESTNWEEPYSCGLHAPAVFLGVLKCPQHLVVQHFVEH